MKTHSQGSIPFLCLLRHTAYSWLIYRLTKCMCLCLSQEINLKHFQNVSVSTHTKKALLLLRRLIGFHCFLHFFSLSQSHWLQNSNTRSSKYQHRLRLIKTHFSFWNFKHFIKLSAMLQRKFTLFTFAVSNKLQYLVKWSGYSQRSIMLPMKRRLDIFSQFHGVLNLQ